MHKQHNSPSPLQRKPTIEATKTSVHASPPLERLAKQELLPVDESESRVTLPEIYEKSEPVTAFGKMNSHLVNRFGKSNRFSVTIGDEVISDCRKIKPEEVDKEWLLKLDKPVFRKEDGGPTLTLPNAPAWKTKFLGGGVEKEVFLVVDDQQRAAALEVRQLFEGQHYENLGSITPLKGLGSIDTVASVEESRKGASASYEKETTIRAREYVVGEQADALSFMDSPKSPVAKAANAVLSFPMRIAGAFMEASAINASKKDETWVPSELHGGNVIIEEQSSPITEDGVAFIPALVVRPFNSGPLKGRSGPTVRWLKSRVTELSAR